MVLLACKCLNIKLFIKHTENEYRLANEQNLKGDYIPTGFFPSGEVEVELDTKGILQEHGYLVHRRKHGNYLVFRCLNCGMDAYAMHMNGSPIVVNNQLLSDATSIDRLKHSPEYSCVFHMVLQNKDTQFSGSMPDPKSSSYENVQSTLNSIQRQLTDFIIQEEAAVDERIRAFEEAQREAFQGLQTKLKEEKKQMISLLLTSAQFETNNTEETQRKDSSKRLTEARKSPAKKKTVSRVKSLPPMMEKDPDDPLFSFDGMESEEPFYQDSSSDENEDDESFVTELPRTRSKPEMMYSSSVPVSVPAWNRQHRTDFLDESEDLTPSEPDQIAASMQALAQQSITDDNRYIFGDRPRPRLNTGDFNNR
ncbi:uncharacterized protein LOC123536750 [Mercenaria mercenaria]|uniref:uncharacterized protein LOC123536750 n=1 Tax=Mercenaria mercenaria TaxID=6596 RepID=UPI00234E8388|nr:uncharacterized protein LOC123536750 [Mercenaria mercenaria]